MEQWASNRPSGSPFYEREQALGAEFFEAAGWERPYWYDANEPLLDEYGDRVMPREAEWESRWWSPIINAEHLAMRDRVGMVDLSAFVDLRRHRARRLRYLERLCVNKVDVAVGPDGLHAAPQRRRRDPRRPHDHAAGPRPLPGRDRRRHGHARQEAASPTRCRRTAPRSSSTRRTEWTTIGLWGPRARDVLAGVTTDDVCHAGFPFLTSKAVDINGVRTLASRI